MPHLYAVFQISSNEMPWLAVRALQTGERVTMARNPLPVLLDRTKYEIRAQIAVWPSLFLPLMRRRSRYRKTIVGPQTELVIEGYPRSGNTFAYAAFRLAQQREVNVARHLHAPAHIAFAVRKHLPCLVLIRQPADAVVSQVIFQPTLTLRQCLRNYVRFHRSIARLPPRFVLATFDRLTDDYGAILREVNELFGTDFRLFEHSPENVSRAFDLVEVMDRAETGLETVQETTVARPSVGRKAMKLQLRRQLEAPRLRPLLRRAESAYEALL